MPTPKSQKMDNVCHRCGWQPFVGANLCVRPALRFTLKNTVIMRPPVAWKGEHIGSPLQFTVVFSNDE